VSANPADRRYSKSHEWFKQDGEVVIVGITQHAADELTDITFVDLPAAGTTIEAGTAFGEIESVKATSELFSSIGGEITESNSLLSDEPERVNTDPFESGWMIKIKPSNPDEWDSLLDVDAYKEVVAKEED